MFGLGTTELLIVLGIAVLVFGASRLPELGRGLGQGMRGFRDALKGEDAKAHEHGADGDPIDHSKHP